MHETQKLTNQLQTCAHFRILILFSQVTTNWNLPDAMALLILKILCPKAKLKRSSTDVQRCSQPLSSNPDWSCLHTNQHGNQCHQMRALFWSSNSSEVFVWMLVYINTDMISSSPFQSFYRVQSNYITTRWQVEQTLPIILKLKYSAAFEHEIKAIYCA
jgi:hypothetical protein